MDIVADEIAKLNAEEVASNMEDYFRGEIMMWANKNSIEMVSREYISTRYWIEVYIL